MSEALKALARLTEWPGLIDDGRPDDDRVECHLLAGDLRVLHSLLPTLRAALSPEPVSMDGIHAAKSILIMQTAPIRLSIMQGRQVSDQDRAISNAVEDLDAAIKGFVRAAPSPPSFREIHPDEYTFGPGPGTLAEFKAQNPPVTDEHPLSGVTHEMWSEMVRMSNAPVGDGEVEAIRGRAENWPAIGLDDRPGALTPFGEACADRATLLSELAKMGGGE